ncbi:MAG TPA: tRNA (adenosine(37)-N6)-threonylcarbamoyltransferase complex ATPase subunit type 1 TsaE [Chthoniobacterales bacterium]
MKTTTIVHSLAELDVLAKDLASTLPTTAVIQLDGTLGAGKTHFVKALARALGYPGDVSSPTFPLVHEYRWDARLLVHIDFYRLEDENEIYAAGLEEYLPGEGVAVVEWASRFPEVFPEKTWRIHIDILDENSREVTIESPDY